MSLLPLNLLFLYLPCINKQQFHSYNYSGRKCLSLPCSLSFFHSPTQSINKSYWFYFKVSPECNHSSPIWLLAKPPSYFTWITQWSAVVITAYSCLFLTKQAQLISFPTHSYSHPSGNFPVSLHLRINSQV